MIAIVLPSVYFLFCCFFIQYKKCDIRLAISYSAVAMGVSLTIFTEILSSFQNLDFTFLLSAWLSLGLVLLAMTATHVSRIYFQTLSQCQHGWRIQGWLDRLYVLYMVALISCAGLMAWIAPPNTFDSMTYHLSRVMHWIQNNSVDFYPTTILRQLLSAPWAEYAILNTVILSGSDRLANFVQWFSMLGSVIIVSSVAKEIGANKCGQLFAALLCATIPMGILQSTSTQNDYVVSFWLLCFVYFSLRFYNNACMVDAIFAGLALGLGLLTKPTAYIYALPFVAWLVLSSLSRFRASKTILFLSGLSLALFINAGHFYRNYQFSGTPLGQTLETGDYSYENSAFGIKVTASNILRNVGLHLESKSKFDSLTQRAIEHAHRYLGISIRDARTTWPEYEFRVQGLKHHEDYAGNLWHTLLILATLFIYLLFLRKERYATGYMFALAAAFVIFCAYLRWQPWHSRLHLPLFVLWAPFVGLIIGRIESVRLGDVISIQTPLLSLRAKWWGTGLYLLQKIKIKELIGITLMCASVTWIYTSETKPLTGKYNIFKLSREAQLFYGAPHLEVGYRDAAAIISMAKCSKIALYAFSNDWEYPIWALLQASQQTALEIRHITASALSPMGKPIQKPDTTLGFEPCAIVAPATVANKTIQLNGHTYHLALSNKAINLYQ